MDSGNSYMLCEMKKDWIYRVSLILPALELTINCFGPNVAIEALDLVYHDEFRPEEGALYLAYLRYSTLLRERDPRAIDLKQRIRLAEEVWKPAGRVTAENVKTWRERAVLWERAAKIC